ncbi:MAG TPA: FGGY family carbohydrate kinase [Acidimicrobiia bacterium]|nr:FGGY family carbohydrate kinase [Acidimicrobiia bacterium]
MVAFVGCDLGTMGTKAAVVSLDGQILGQAFEEVPLHTPRPGVAEQSLDEIEVSAHRTIRTAVERAGDVEIGGIAFSGQMSGIGTIDDDFHPATHFDSWLDSRCAPYILEMGQNDRRVTELSGCPPTYSHGPKILWWKHERPRDFERIAKFLVPAAYVAGRLCELKVEDTFIDRTYLHFTNLADTKSAVWSSELLEGFGVDSRLLPRIVDPLDVVGEVGEEAARVTGLPVGTPVVAGAGDQAAAALGAGVVDPGQAFDSSGTACVFALCLDEYAPDVANRTFMATHSVLAGTFLSVAFINGGGLALRWFRDEVAGLSETPDAYETLHRMAGEVEIGSGNLLWYPHFQGRVLPPDPNARGGWMGLTGGHRLGHMFRAILEGIAYQYAEWANLMSEAGGKTPDEARVLGGGARSGLWNQIKADVLGIEWVPTTREDCGVLGDALIAAVGTGRLDVSELAETARRWQPTGESIRPDPERHTRYRHYREAFRELADVSGSVFRRLGG